MPSIAENHEFWNDRFHWGKHRGDVWSARWGGPQAQWQWCVYPRIRKWLPASTILEIGCGMGRWTRFLREFCEELVVVDLSERCLAVCAERFPEVVCRNGDGRTLDFQQDSTIDLVFSFESLVHTEMDDMRSYLAEIARVLKPGGSCFLHHSNLGNYKGYFRWVRSLPESLRTPLQDRGILDFDGWRALSVDHLSVKKEAEAAGLGMLSQELVPWGSRRLIDCFSVFQLGEVESAGKVLENSWFTERAAEIRKISTAYVEPERHLR